MTDREGRRIQMVVDEIRAFGQKCEDDAYTDTGEVHELLTNTADTLASLLKQAKSQ